MLWSLNALMLFMLLVSSPAYAADPQLDKQVEILQQEVAFLKNEVAILKNIFNLTPDSTLRVTAKLHKLEVTGGNEQHDVGGNLQIKVNGSAVEYIGLGQTETIGQDKILKIGKSYTQQIGGDFNVTTRQRIYIAAGDQLILQTGQASLILNKNGDVALVGKNIQIKGSSDVTIKGRKIIDN